MHRRYWLALAFAMAGPLALLNCSSEDDSSSTSPTSSNYRGVLTGANESGVLDVKVVDDSTSGIKTLSHGGVMQVSATLNLAGVVVALTGTLDPATGAFALSGGGYTLTGKVGHGGIAGSYTGPNGTGTFALLPTSSASQAAVFCGSFDGDDVGVWNVSAVPGGQAIGAWAAASGSKGTFAGTWSTVGALKLAGDPISADGTLQSSGVGSGTWTSTDSHKGKWTTGACKLTKPGVDAGTGSDGDVTPLDAGKADATTVDGSLSDAGLDGNVGTDAGTGSDATSGTDASTGLDGSVGTDAGSSTDASTGFDASTGLDGGAATDGSVGLDAGASSDAGTGADGSVATDASVGLDAGASSDASTGADGSVATDASVGSDGGVGSDAGTDASAGLDYQDVYTDFNMCTLATDGSYIYVGYCKNGGIKRFAINASDAGAGTTVVTAAGPNAMTISGGVVYWLDNSSKIMSAPAGSTSAGGTILGDCSNITGSGALDVYAGRAYWIDRVYDNALMTYVGQVTNVAIGGGTSAAIVPASERVNGLAIDHNTGEVFYQTPTALRVISLPSGSPTSSLVKTATVRNLVTANGFLYWAEGTTLFSRFGTTIQTVGTLPSGNGFAIASDFVYAQSNTGNLILKTTINLPGTSTQLTTDTTSSGFLVAQPYVYWRTNDTTHLRRTNW